MYKIVTLLSNDIIQYYYLFIFTVYCVIGSFFCNKLQILPFKWIMGTTIGTTINSRVLGLGLEGLGLRFGLGFGTTEQ